MKESDKKDLILLQETHAKIVHCLAAQGMDKNQLGWAANEALKSIMSFIRQTPTIVNQHFHNGEFEDEV